MQQTPSDQIPVESENMEKLLTTRPATEADYEFALKTHHDAYKEIVRPVFGWNETKQDDFFRDSWSPATYQIILADGTEIGYCNVEYEDDHLLLDELVLSPKFQGLGMGKEILRRIIQRAISEEKLLKLQVLKNNPAKRLYDISGFKVKEEDKTHFKMVFDPKSVSDSESSDQLE